VHIFTTLVDRVLKRVGVCLVYLCFAHRITFIFFDSTSSEPTTLTLVELKLFLIKKDKISIMPFLLSSSPFFLFAFSTLIAQEASLPLGAPVSSTVQSFHHSVACPHSPVARRPNALPTYGCFGEDLGARLRSQSKLLFRLHVSWLERVKIVRGTKQTSSRSAT
jgi:hypothetical protein